MDFENKKNDPTGRDAEESKVIREARRMREENNKKIEALMKDNPEGLARLRELWDMQDKVRKRIVEMISEKEAEVSYEIGSEIKDGRYPIY